MKNIYKNFFILAITVTIGTMLWLLFSASLSEQPVFLTYSINRLLLNIVVLIFLTLLVLGLWGLKFAKFQKYIQARFQSKNIFILLVILISICIFSLVVYYFGFWGNISVYFQKMFPILLLVFLLSLETILFQLLISKGEIFLSSIINVKKYFSEKTGFFVIFFFIIYFVIMFFSLTRGHDWGDDFAQYIMQSKSLLSGTMNEYIRGTEFTNNNSSYSHSPMTASWGFSILLLPFIKIFDQNILGLKLANILIYSGFLVILYKWSRFYLSKLISMLILLFFAVNPMFIGFQNRLMSDLLFLFCSTISINFIERYYQNSKYKTTTGILLGFFVFYACFTRANGYFLLISLLFVQVAHLIQEIIRKQKIDIKKMLVESIPYLVFFLLMIVQKILLPNYSKTVESYVENIATINVFEKIGYYFWLPSEIFSGTLYPKILYLLTLPFLLCGIVSNRKSLINWSVILYSILTLGLYIFFPGQQGIRYLFPLLPIYVIYMVLGIIWLGNSVKQKIKTLFSVFFIMIYSIIIGQFLLTDLKYAVHNLNFNRIEFGGPYSTSSTEMLTYIQTNTPSDSVIVFFKPRAMRLLTGRDSIFSLTCENLKIGDYYVHEKSPEFEENKRQMSISELNSCIDSMDMDILFENDSSVIFKIP